MFLQHPFIKIFITLLLAFSFYPSITFAKPAPSHPFPRLANYYLHGQLTESAARELAKWDLVILDMEIQVNGKHLLKKIRELNPNIVILAYITTQEIRADATVGGSKLRRKLAQGIPAEWYLTKSDGTRLSFWPGTYLLNVTNKAPVINGRRFNDYMARFIADEVLATGLWDGVFYDNTWDTVTWTAGSDVDLNRDGLPDQNVDAAWAEGMLAMMNETRRLTSDKYLIVGNSPHRAYRNELDGKMIESFNTYYDEWDRFMNLYAHHQGGARAPTFTVINNNAGNTNGQNNYRAMRFGLGSTLLENGYYSYDYGDKDHGQTWWYDEYNVDLGKPVTVATSPHAAGRYSPDVWQRTFTHGVVVVNSTGEKQKVVLSGDYEKIHGTQDPAVNDGAIVSEAVVQGNDSIILLNPLEKLDDVLFTNGSFARFFLPDGTRARNGFFVFDEAYKGGASVGRIDLDGNSVRDFIVATGNKLTAMRDDGQPLMKVYPYGANYKGQIKVAVGDMDGDGFGEIFVFPTAREKLPIKIYARDGANIVASWLPYGEKFDGGYSVAVGNIEKGGAPEIVVGGGVGQAPKVRLYQRIFNRFKLLREWLAFESSFKGGVNVAAGDVNGDGVDEIIVAAVKNKKPVIKIFDRLGKKLYQEFSPFSGPVGRGSIEVYALDVNFDGKDEIVTLSSGI